MIVAAVLQHLSIIAEHNESAWDGKSRLHLQPDMFLEAPDHNTVIIFCVLRPRRQGVKTINH